MISAKRIQYTSATIAFADTNHGYCQRFFLVMEFSYHKNSSTDGLKNILHTL